jgi:Glycosyltransferase like family
MSNIAIFTCTKENTTPMLKYSVDVINEYIKNPIAVHVYKNNKEGLSKRYNEFLYSEHIYDYIVFCHDDVYFDDALLGAKLEKYHKDYDIIGVAGGNNCKIQAPALWHLMCGGFGSGNLHGAVAHLHNRCSMTTSFGPTPARVAIIDGVFMSVNVKKVKNVGWKFNENYTFHHYDIASCLDANQKKLKIGVAPIHLTHASPGLRDFNDKAFQKNQTQFLKEYASY